MTDRWLVAACVVGVALLVGWSGGQARSRYRSLVAAGDRPAGSPFGATATSFGGTVGPSGSDGAAGGRAWLRVLDRRLAAVAAWRLVLLGAVLGGTAGALVAGPVAAVVCAGYAGLAVRGLARRRALRHAQRVRREQLDGLCALAADLRAGLSPPAPLPVPSLLPPVPVSPLSTAARSGVPRRSRPVSRAAGLEPPVSRAAGVERPATQLANPTGPVTRLTELTSSAVRLAEQTGAPLADLVERIEADARATDRGLAAADAQAAGARATGWLLAVLPLGGIALGYGIGVDPLRILLYTPIGAACAVAAVALQVAGLLWTDRLSGSARTT